MKSIAIITAIRTLNNYGQILQAYALCTYLRNRGFEASLIDFAYEIDWNTIPPVSFCSKMKYYLKTSPLYRLFESAKDKCGFLKFKRKHLNVYPRKYSSFRSLLEYPPKANIYITGSDQIWGNHIKRIEAFFLSFGGDDIKRVAYAPSFGTPSLTPDRIARMAPLIARYSAVGVREKSGVAISQTLNFHNSEWVPDPTLLLTEEDWLLIGSQESPFKTTHKKVFVYIIGNDNDQRILELAKSIPGAEIIVESDSPDRPAEKAFLSIHQWIRAVSDCDYVITNSFHGTMFSLIFNKRFLTFERIGESEHMNVRVKSIAEITSLENRLIANNVTPSVKDLNDQINWSDVNRKLADWRKVGIEFLKKNLD